GRRNELVLPPASQRESASGGAQAAHRVTVDQARVEGLRMLSSRDLGEQRRRAISLPRLGQQLHQAEPAAGLRDGRCGDTLDELRCAFSMTGATVGGDGGAHVGDRRLDPERLKEVQEQLGVLRSIYRASTPHLRVAELAKQDPKLAIRAAA